jgi:hypothetical protein
MFFFVTTHKYQTFSKFHVEFGQYITIDTKVPLRMETFMKIHVLLCTYLFFNQLNINIKKDVLGSKSFLSLVQSNGMSFLIEQRLYNYEIYFLKPSRQLWI